FRSQINFQNVPITMSRYGATQVRIAPAPSTVYNTDWDLAILSGTLVNLTDVDPLPYPYTEPVPFYAAYRAELWERRYDKADVFLGYLMKAMEAIEGARIGEMQSAYFSLPGQRYR